MLDEIPERKKNDVPTMTWPAQLPLQSLTLLGTSGELLKFDYEETPRLRYKLTFLIYHVLTEQASITLRIKH